MAVITILGCSPIKHDVTKSEKKNVSNASTNTKDLKVEKAIANESKTSLKIADHVLSGEINSKKWTFVAGKAKRAGDKLQIVLYDQPIKDCGEPADPKAPSVLLPDQNLTPGEGHFSYEIMGGFRYITDKPQNDFAVEGNWRIDSVGPKTVSGGLAIKYRNHLMNGIFTVPLCE